MKLAAYALLGVGAYLLFQGDTVLMGLGISWIISGLILRAEPSEDSPGPLTPA